MYEIISGADGSRGTVRIYDIRGLIAWILRSTLMHRGVFPEGEDFICEEPRIIEGQLYIHSHRINKDSELVGEVRHEIVPLLNKLADEEDSESRANGIRDLARTYLLIPDSSYIKSKSGLEQYLSRQVTIYTQPT